MSRVITLTIVLFLPAWGYPQTLPSIVARGAAVEVGRSDGVAESPGASLGAGDSVRTGSASFAVIAFEDGSRVTLGERSAMTISALDGMDGMTAVRLERGSVRARSGLCAVRIETPAGDFTLSELPAEAEFALIDGKVTIYVANPQYGFPIYSFSPAQTNPPGPR